MNVTLNERGFHEIVLCESTEYEDFYSFTSKLKNILKIEYQDKIDDFDTLYWVFYLDEHSFVVSYNTFQGISVYPSSTIHETNVEIEILEKIARALQ
jgi:hypothetical protein